MSQTINLKRSQVVELFQALGLETASALSTSRLQKKVNLLYKVVKDDTDLESDRLNDLLDTVLDALDGGVKVIVKEDRKSIPNVETQEPAARVRRFDGKKSKYDWNQILNGSIVSLEQGVDYDCKSSAFAMQVRSAAKRRGQKVRVSTKQGTVIVQAVDE